MDQRPVLRRWRSFRLNTMADLCSSPVFWIIVTAVSEIIGMSKLKDNSIIEVVLNTLKALKPKEK